MSHINQSLLQPIAMKLLTRGYWKIFVLTVFALVVPVSGILIADCIENCTSDQVTIGDTLENLTSNTILRFTPGVHVLQISIINHEFENVSLFWRWSIEYHHFL